MIKNFPILIFVFILIGQARETMAEDSIFREMGPLFTKIQNLQTKSTLDVGVLAYLGAKEAYKYNPKYYKLRFDGLTRKVVGSGVLDKLKQDDLSWSRHLREFSLAYAGRQDRTDDHILTSRSSSRVVHEATMNTCIDFVKAFWQLKDLWPEHGEVTQWKVVYLFPKDLYTEKTCPRPGRVGKRRPFVHTAIAIQVEGVWYVINPEIYPGQETFDIVKVGGTLPDRHTSFDLPSLTKAMGKYAPFSWGGTTPIEMFEEGFDGKLLGNMVISGTVASDICD